MCRGNGTVVVIISGVDLGVVLSLVPQVIHHMLSRFAPSPQYAEAESCKCEDRVWRCDRLELAMEPAMRAQSVRTKEPATNALCREVEHAMLRALQEHQ